MKKYFILSFASHVLFVGVASAALSFGLDARVEISGAPGSRVNIRATPGGIVQGERAAGEQGSIVSSNYTIARLPNGTTHRWWLVRFNDNVEGWVSQERLKLIDAGTVSITNTRPSSAGDMTIRAPFRGSDIVIKTTNRLAGAIDSLVWNGKEFVDSVDHGRQIQTAWAANGRGECFNPTEAGSDRDGTGSVSSSFLLATEARGNSLTTLVRPAFWLPPGIHGAWCNFDVTHPQLWRGGDTINTKTTSDSILKKTVTIGHAGLANAIEYISEITLAENELALEPHRYILLQNPSVHVPVDFSKLYKLDIASGNLIELGPVVPSFSTVTLDPLILATPDHAYAIGVYTDEITPAGFPDNEQRSVAGYMMIDSGVVRSITAYMPKNPPSGNMFTPGTYRYRSFMAVGNRTNVKNTLLQLAALYPNVRPAPPPLPAPIPPPLPVAPPPSPVPLPPINIDLIPPTINPTTPTTTNKQQVFIGFDIKDKPGSGVATTTAQWQRQRADGTTETGALIPSYGWVAYVTLNQGQNLFTITVKDNAGNTATYPYTLTYMPVTSQVSGAQSLAQTLESIRQVLEGLEVYLRGSIMGL